VLIESTDASPGPGGLHALHAWHRANQVSTRLPELEEKVGAGYEKAEAPLPGSPRCTAA